MLRACASVAISVVSALLLTAGHAGAQEYPNKPIRIVTTGLGGGTDFVARLIGQGITGPLGQPLIIDNRSGVITSELVAKAPPDGYTLLVIGQAHWIGPLMQEVPYDAIRDYAPITIADRSPSVVVVHPSLPVKSVAELIALAKGKPGQLNFGSIQAGSAAHLAGELFKYMAGVNLVWVPYKTMGAAVTDLVSNQIQITFSTPASVMPQVSAGRLRALAVATLQPSALTPGLPTAASTGLPGYEAASITAVFAPARTPAAIIGRLNREIVRLVGTEDVKSQLFKTGAEAVGSSPEELAAALKADIAKYGKVISEAKISVK
jgi:tripartite-type tricarboxylate transporter receptor subunit TctC